MWEGGPVTKHFENQRLVTFLFFLIIYIIDYLTPRHLSNYLTYPRNCGKQHKVLETAMFIAKLIQVNTLRSS